MLSWTLRQIANEINRSVNVIHSFLKNPEEYGTAKRIDRPTKLSPRDIRRIINVASNSTKSTLEIRNECELSVHRETVRRVLAKISVIVHTRLMKAPALKPIHKLKRLDFARKNMDTNWKYVSLPFYLY